jgi:hypothetical protein
MGKMPNEVRLSDRQRELLLKGLRQAFLAVSEISLFRRGKSVGLFPSASGMSGEVAQFALESGYLESVRTEVIGKRSISWVRLTSKGTEYLYQQESPRAILNDLRDFLKTTGSGLPTWMDRMLVDLGQVAERFGQELSRISTTMESLTSRVEEAIRRADASGVTSDGSLSMLVPWAFEALQYLDHRKSIGAALACPMHELYEALRTKNPGLSISQFHGGLRRLVTNHAIKLLPQIANQSLARPEFAMLDQGQILYLVDR